MRGRSWLATSTVLVAAGAALALPADRQAARLAGPLQLAPLQLVLVPPPPAASVGDPYRYEACRPAPVPPNQCGGPSHQPLSPRGGSPPYTFFAQGFLPKGLHLDTRTGILSGRPAAGTDRVWSFKICARDLNRMQACAAARIVVRPRFDGHYCGTTHVEVTAAGAGVNAPPVKLDRPLEFTVRQGVISGGAAGRVLDATGHAELTIPLPGGGLKEEEQFAPENGAMTLHGTLKGDLVLQQGTVHVEGRFDATRTDGPCP